MELSEACPKNKEAPATLGRSHFRCGGFAAPCDGRGFRSARGTDGLSSGASGRSFCFGKEPALLMRSGGEGRRLFTPLHFGSEMFAPHGACPGSISCHCAWARNSVALRCDGPPCSDHARQGSLYQVCKEQCIKPYDRDQ